MSLVYPITSHEMMVFLQWGITKSTWSFNTKIKWSTGMIFWYPYSNPPDILFHPYKVGGLQALKPLDVEVQALAAMQDDARDEPHREVMEEIPRDGIWLRVNLQNLARLCDFNGFSTGFSPKLNKTALNQQYLANTWIYLCKMGKKNCRP